MLSRTLCCCAAGLIALGGSIALAERSRSDSRTDRDRPDVKTRRVVNDRSAHVLDRFGGERRVDGDRRGGRDGRAVVVASTGYTARRADAVRVIDSPHPALAGRRPRIKQVTRQVTRVVRRDDGHGRVTKRSDHRGASRRSDTHQRHDAHRGVVHRSGHDRGYGSGHSTRGVVVFRSTSGHYGGHGSHHVSHGRRHGGHYGRHHNHYRSRPHYSGSYYYSDRCGSGFSIRVGF